MVRVGVRQLKAQLSGYLRQVRAGDVIVVTDHGEVVAELRPAGTTPGETSAERRMREAVAAGWIQLPAKAHDRGWLDESSAGLPRGTAAALLDAERGPE
jgi:prevent-host-death family protein